jgi:hypothetical protein
MEIIDVSSTTGEGLDRWMDWLKARQKTRAGAGRIGKGEGSGSGAGKIG